MKKPVLAEGFDPKENIKKRIKDAVVKTIREFETQPGRDTRFEEPLIGYISAKHPIFMRYLEEDICLHPKAIYRPGNTVVVFMLPYAEEIVKSNKGGDMPSEQWTKAFYDSMHLSMTVGRVIRETLDEVGRLHSNTNIPTDWNTEEHREEWSHKLAAYAAGMGRFGIAGSFHTELGFAGRWGSIIVDEHYAIFEEEDLEMWDFENVVDHIMTDCKYEGAEDVAVSQEAIDACPGGAVSEKGIDREKCQQWCQKVNSHIPSQEVCGKCFFYDK